MKVLIATGIFPPEIGGPATYAKLLADELPKRGIDVDVLPFRDVRGYPRVIRHIVYFFKVLVRSRNCDLIFTQDPVSTGVPVVLARLLSGKKVVMRVAGDYAWEQASQRYGGKDSIDDFQNKKYGFSIELIRSFQKWSVARADAVVTPSEYFSRLVSGWMPAHNDSSRMKKVITIYNGINLAQEFEKLPKYSEPTIVTAGRLVPWKGFDTLIGLLPKMSGWKLIIAGDGPDRKRLEGLIGSAGLKDRVTLLGNIPRPELFSHIYRSHVFALLSTFESFSFQIVEAMYVGTSVIAADIGNISEIIEQGKQGILIDPTHGEMFVKEAQRIYSDKTYADMLSDNAKKRAQDFSVTKTVDKLVDLMKNAVSSKNV